ncbi:MAG: exonuclease SbcCD subunit D C-terminal domain-containing protein, partial [Allobranchiibius sp.]
RGMLTDLLHDPAHADAESAWCEVTLTDAARPPAAMEQVRRRFPHTLMLGFDQPATAINRRSYADRVKGRGDLDLCCDFTNHVRGGAAVTDDERAVWRAAFEESRVERELTGEQDRSTSPDRGVA